MTDDLALLREYGEHLAPADPHPPADLRRRVLAQAFDPRHHRARFSLRDLPFRLTSRLRGLSLRFGSRPAVGGLSLRSSPPPAVRSLSLRPGSRPGLRVAGGLGVALTLTAALFAGPVVLTAGKPSPAPAATTAPAPVTAPNLLMLAAEQTAAAPALTARPDQFLFVDLVTSHRSYRFAAPDKNGVHPPATMISFRPTHEHHWRSVDGTRDGLERVLDPPAGFRGGGKIPGCRKGKQDGPRDRPGTDQDCEPYPAFRTDLPDTTEAMRRWLYRPADKEIAGGFLNPGASADHLAFLRVDQLLHDALHSPAVQAAALSVAESIPGVEYLPSATDVSGREGVAVARVDQGMRVELIFDPKTYRHLGSNHVVVGPHGPRDRLVRELKVGDRVSSWAILGVAVVDKVGKRP